MGKNSDYWERARIKFVFTTHATTLGRHLSAGQANLNDVFNTNPDANYGFLEAEKRGIAIEHKIEREAAQEAEVLTTVSTITGRECEHFLGRKPDVITWNGLHVNS